jgi:hypothetical protein
MLSFFRIFNVTFICIVLLQAGVALPSEINQIFGDLNLLRACVDGNADSQVNQSESKNNLHKIL